MQYQGFMMAFAPILLGFGLCLTQISSAETVIPVLTVTTDAFAGVSYIDVVKNDSGSVTAMIYRPNDGRIQNMSVAELQAQAQVLKEVDGRKIMTLQLNVDFSPEKGGHATLRFLQSGMSDTYKNFRILIDNQKDIVLRSDPDRNDYESDHNNFTSVFNFLFLRANRFFGMIIGVSRVEPSFR